MRIAYVCGDPGVPVFGKKGCSIHVQEVVRALVGHGVSVELFAASIGGAPPADLQGVPVHPLPLRPAGSNAAEARESALLASNPAWARALESAGGFDAVYERYSLWSWAPMEYARRRGIPGLLEVNAPLVEEQAAHRGLLDEAGAHANARRVFHAASMLLAVSEEVGLHLASYPAAAGKIEVVPNGVNPGRFAPALTIRRQRRASDTAGATIGFVGSLKPWHGTELLLESFAALRARRPSARLLVVGDGPERSRLEARAGGLSLNGSVRFTGAVSADEVPGWLGAMDVAVAPYPALSGFYFSPLKVYEYMAAGLPVVASRIGQIRHVLDHEVNGILVEPGQRDELTSALEMLVDNPRLRERLGWAARASVEHRHTWAAVATRILTLVRHHAVQSGSRGEGIAPAGRGFVEAVS